MNIQKTTKIALLTAIIAITGARCWGAAPNHLNDTNLNDLNDLDRQLARTICRGGYNNPYIDRSGQPEKIKQLIALGADIHFAEYCECASAITMAVKTQYFPIVQAVLEAGANVNYHRMNREAALSVAVRHYSSFNDRNNQIAAENSLEIIRLLLQYGADIGDLGPTLEAMGVEVYGG